MAWAGNFSWQRGLAAAGTLALNFSAGSNPGRSFDIVLPTPDSFVLVTGAIPWQVTTANPVNIRFTADDGSSFSAPVSADRTFSLSLPNLVSYQVHVQSQNSTGYRDWYYAHTLQVAAGANVIGLVVRISL